MPIFGQVWLWSSLAFLLGAVLCWLLVARPARNRVGELESQLATRARRQPVAERPEPSRRRDDEDEFSRSLVPGLGEAQTESDSDYLTRSYALRENPPPPPPERGQNRDFSEPELFGVFDAPPEPPETQQPAPSSTATQYLDVSAGSLTAPPEVPPASPPPSDRGWFDDELEGDAANQGPEEQAAVPRNRHHMVGSFVDDDMNDMDDLDEAGEAGEEPSIGSALGGEPVGAPPAAEEPRSAIEDDSGGTVFTQRTQPIARELIRQIDEAGSGEEAQPDALVDDLADDPAEPPAVRSERTVESEPVEAPEETAVAEQETTVEEAVQAPQEPSVPPEEPAEQTEVVAAVQEKSNELPRRVPMQSKMPGVAVRVDPTPNALPKRVPGRPRHQVPFGVQADQAQEPAAAGTATATTTTATAATTVTTAVAEAEQADVTRSLFEPIVPAADEGTSTPPPPHRLRQASTGGRGPFGPGSAMPLPGGASPSPEFTIKASVAALRYCTPESPQFGRTVAEVWFRTAADAERVGFRPVG